MEQKPVFMTTYAMARLLKEYAMRLGMEEIMADATAQIHMQQTQIPQRWSDFLAGNCTFCAKNPQTCDFMNPQEHNCKSGTPEAVKAANATMVEKGKFVNCPSFIQQES